MTPKIDQDFISRLYNYNQHQTFYDCQKGHEEKKLARVKGMRKRKRKGQEKIHNGPAKNTSKVKRKNYLLGKKLLFSKVEANLGSWQPKI